MKLKRVFREVRIIGMAAILFWTLALSGCTKSTSLAKFGNVIGPLTDIVMTEIKTLYDAKAISQEKYDAIVALEPSRKAHAIGAFISGFTITAGNKQELITKIREGSDLVVSLLGGAPVGSKAAKIITYIRLALDGASLAVVILNPPQPSISSGAGAGIRSEAVKVKLPPVDAEVAAVSKAAEEAAKP